MKTIECDKDEDLDISIVLTCLCDSFDSSVRTRIDGLDSNQGLVLRIYSSEDGTPVEARKDVGVIIRHFVHYYIFRIQESTQQGTVLLETGRLKFKRP